MPGKKKTNFIAHELERLDKYVKQLQKYLDDNPPHKLQDRVEYIDLPRGGQTVKVIASKETQLSKFMDVLKQMPSLLEDINKLKKSVDGEEDEQEIRGGQTLPGFMNKRSKKEQPTKPKKVEQVDVDEEFDDDPLDEEKPKSSTKLLLGSTIEDIDSEDIVEEDEQEEEEEDPWERDFD